MTQLTTFDTGDRMYGRVVFLRSDYEVDTCVGTTATVVLVDPADALTPVTPVVTNTASTVQVDWEITPTSPPPGVWWAIVQTATALVAHDEAPFRVLRSRVDA